MSTTGWPAKESMPTAAASGLVALESLYQRTPPHSPTSSSRCSTPAKEAIADSISAGGTPASRPTAAAALAFIRLCAPGTGIGGAGSRSNQVTGAGRLGGQGANRRGPGR